MKCDKQNMLLYAVTDRAWVGKQTLYEQVESALKGGVTCVQLREKELDDEAFSERGCGDSCSVPALRRAVLCERQCGHCHPLPRRGCACGAGGYGCSAGARPCGRGNDDRLSVHSVEEAREAVKHGADCLGVGAAFATHTKTDVDVLPHETLKAICDAVDIPVVAIGGIHKENILQLKGTGVDGVALVSAILQQTTSRPSAKS